MQLLFYNIFLWLYRLALHFAALFHEKAAKWVRGRRDLFQTIKTTLPHNEKRIWVHCASLGEFEQGRPLIESLRKEYPDHKILLSFFSPSGYEACRSYELADYIFYLPMDGRKRSRRFVRMVNPSLAIFVKYEFWYYYLCNLERNNIPAIIVSGAFRESQPFFKWYGGFFRKMLSKLSHFFVQDEASKQLLNRIGINAVTVSGDTRYDRVSEIEQAARSFPVITQWQGSSKLLVAGSTWPEDEQMLRDCLKALPEDWKLIIAPHEVDKAHISRLQQLFGGSQLYSALNEAPKQNMLPPGPCRVLIIDNIGMLSALYRCGEIAYIGGGFKKGGIHNTLEPAVFGLPVIFGPVYQKFTEAVQLVRHEFGFPVHNAAEFKSILHRLCSDGTERKLLQIMIKTYMQEQRGATERIMDLIRRDFLGKKRGIAA